MFGWITKNKNAGGGFPPENGADEAIYEYVIWRRAGQIEPWQSICLEAGVFLQGETGLFGQYLALYVVGKMYRWELDSFWADRERAADHARRRGEQVAAAFGPTE